MNLLSYILRLTLNRKGNQDRPTISLYSNQKAPSRRNNRSCRHNIRRRVLFLCSLQGSMCNCVSTLKILSIGNFHRRNLKNICSQGQRIYYLRIACLAIVIMKTQQNFGSRFKKRIACRLSEVEMHIPLPCQLTANYFAHRLKEGEE